jgi:D-sedoheptulose 7-phosphate isomerase
MSASKFFSDYFVALYKAMSSVDALDLESAGQLIQKAQAAGGKVIVVGNGGSAAIASHVTVDLTKAAGIRAVNFNEADLLTCLSNDFGYEHWVERALEFWADPGDLVVTISSSGTSLNMVNGAHRAKSLGLDLITLSGFHSDNPLRQLGKLNLWVDSTEFNIIETAHQAWLLAVVDYLINLERRSA